MRFAIFFFLILIFCNSCTIEKRLHGRGYHISWNKKYSRVKKDDKKKKLESEEVVDEETIDTLGSTGNEQSLLEEDPITPPEPIDSTELSKEDRKKERAQKYPKLPRAERKFEPLGVKAVKLLALDGLLVIWGDHEANHQSYFMIMLSFLIILAIVFVLGIVSMIRYLLHPRHYRFNIWALLCIFVGALYISFAVMGTLAIF